jgi:hypothetical protein
MANQAIALQARAPQQGNFLAPAIQQGAQMVNMMRQQQALDRQTAVAQQQMEIARARETREAANAPFVQSKAEVDAKAAQMDYDSKAAAVLKNELGMVEPGNIAAVDAWRKRVSDILPHWAPYLPPSEKIAGDRQTQLMLAGTIEQIINKTITTPTTDLNFAPGGKAFAITKGGVNLPRADQVTTGSMVGEPPAAPTPIPMPPAAGVQPMAAPQTPTGGMFQRMSATGGQPQGAAPQGADPQGADPLAPLLASLFEANRTKQISADVVEQLRQLDPRAAPAVDQFLAQTNIQVTPSGGMRSAVYRSDGNAMAPQQIVNRVGAQYVGRDPMQSPAPGIYAVPVPQIAGVAGAETEGRENVRVGTQPRIVAGEERVKRLEKLRGEQPRALADARSVIADMDSRILAIDEFLRNPDRNKIIGSVEGRIPDFLMDESRADVKGLYDAIVNNQVLNELIKGRQQTETGASPMGIVSDRDLAVAAAASNRLRRPGSEKAQDVEMQRLRDILYRTRQLAIKSYGEVYREVAKDAPDLRLDVADIPSRYKARPQSSPATQTATTKAPPGVPAEDWKYMSPEDRALWPQ